MILRKIERRRLSPHAGSAQGRTAQAADGAPLHHTRRTLSAFAQKETAAHRAPPFPDRLLAQPRQPLSAP
jgi:hypothetical protein